MFDLSAFQKIKWGPGVVGRTTVLTGLAMIATLGAALIVPNDNVKTFLGIMVVPEFFTALILSHIFAHKHPSLSVLEGTAATRYKQAEMAAKHITIDQVPKEKTYNSTPSNNFVEGIKDA